MSYLIGQTINEYHVEELLGIGQTGDVFRARNIKNGEYIALKVIDPRTAANPRFQARFRRMLHIATKLDHPNIVKVYGDGEDQTYLYLVMELLTGGTLRALLDRRESEAWPLALGIDLVRQVADALAAAHAQGIIHRDVKPENMLLQRLDLAGDAVQRYVLKLGDFGAARDTTRESSNLTRTDDIIGTMRYMAPEQFKDPSKVSARSDLYSLGVVLYEVATGTQPFVITSQGDALHQHLSVDPPKPSDRNPYVPAALESIILRCLNKNPDARFTSASHLSTALQAVLNGPDVYVLDQVIESPQPLPPPASDVVTISTDQVEVTLVPDHPIEIKVSVTNWADYNDSFMLSIDGVPEDWVTLPTDPVQVLGVDEQENVKSGVTQFTVTLPRSTHIPAGRKTVTIRAHSSANAQETGSTQAFWWIPPLPGNNLHVKPPKTVRGRRKGTFSLRVENTGNTSGAYTLHGRDQDNALIETFVRDGTRLDRKPDNLLLEHQTGTNVDLLVQAQRRRWLSKKPHTFNVELMGGETPKSAELTFVQLPLVPRWITALACLVLLLFCFLVFGPPIVWEVTTDIANPNDNQPVTVRYRVFNAGTVWVRAKSGDWAIEREVAQRNIWSNWLGLYFEEHMIDTGFPGDASVMLVASNIFGLTTNTGSKEIPVGVRKPDLKVHVEPAELTFGQPITFTVNVSPTDSLLTLAGDGQPTNITTTHRLWPSKTTTYQIVAQNARNKEKQSTESLKVVVKPLIDSFRIQVADDANRATGQADQPLELVMGEVNRVRLSWDVKGAETVDILINDILYNSFSPTGGAEVTAPSASTTYTLVANGIEAEVRDTREVTVAPQSCRVLDAEISFYKTPGDPDPHAQYGPLAPETILTPQGRNPDGQWIRVYVPDIDERGWVTAKRDLVECVPEVRLMPVVEPVEIPTLIPTNTPSPTPEPTDTPVPPATPVPTNTLGPPTATPAPFCTVNTGGDSLSLRVGPGTTYDEIAWLSDGTALLPLATNSDRQWIYVQAQEVSRVEGWVSVGFVDCVAIDKLPRIPDPIVATNTPTPIEDTPTPVNTARPAPTSRPPTPEPATPQPATRTPRPPTPVPTPSAFCTHTPGQGDVFVGNCGGPIQPGRGDICVQGLVVDRDGNPFANAFIVVDQRGRTLQVKNYDSQSGSYFQCGLSAGEWGVAVADFTRKGEGITYNSPAEQAKHQVRFKVSGAPDELFQVNFRER